MTSVGETLRQERLRRNVQLQQISDQLKISSRMLEAIEAGEYNKLPGGVFAKSFVRQYAAVLGLDEEEVAAEFERAVQSPELAHLSELRRPQPAARLPRIDEVRFSTASRRGVLPSLIAVVVVMLICSGVYAWWQRNRQLAATRAETPPAAAQQRAPVTAARNQPRRAPGPQVAAAPTGPIAAAQTAAPPAAAPQPLAPDAEVSGTAAVRVELVVAQPVWIRARQDGHTVFEGELEPNQVRTIAANSEVTLRLGNAGGVTILLNGKPIPPAGPEGQIRTIQLTSGGFQIVPPAAPAPASAPKAPALLEPL